MNTDQILKVLKNERECIKRQGTEKCNRLERPITGCKFCDLCLPDTEILEVYDFLIEAYSITEVHINISKEESDKLIEIINRNARQGTRLAAIPYPDTGECYPTVTLETEPEEHGYCDTCKHNGGYPKYETCQECLNYDKYEKGDTD